MFADLIQQVNVYRAKRKRPLYIEVKIGRRGALALYSEQGDVFESEVNGNQSASIQGFLENALACEQSIDGFYWSK